MGESWFQSARNRGKGISKAKFFEDQLLFSFSEKLALDTYVNALKKAGLEARDRNTNRRNLRPRMLRKYFMSMLKLAIQEKIVEALGNI